MKREVVIQVRRRPRDPREGWEVLLDGEWRDYNDAGYPDGSSDVAVHRCQENSSLADLPEVAWPDGVGVIVEVER